MRGWAVAAGGAMHTAHMPPAQPLCSSDEVVNYVCGVLINRGAPLYMYAYAPRPFLVVATSMCVWLAVALHVLVLAATAPPYSAISCCTRCLRSSTGCCAKHVHAHAAADACLGCGAALCCSRSNRRQAFDMRVTPLPMRYLRDYRTRAVAWWSRCGMGSPCGRGAAVPLMTIFPDNLP
eukprot:scaffold3270_cov170-Isochrysis_galbana.AAC.2